MRKSSISLPLLLLLTVCASAGLADTRVRTTSYRPETIVQLSGRPNIESMIAFEIDEHIENVAVGDSMAWQVTPNKRANKLFVKPVTAGARTNMTVITDRRTYLFDLRSDNRADPALYSLSFTYLPPVVRPAPAPVPQPTPAASAPAAKLNFGWKAEGSKRLRPVRSFDDGRSVYLAWQSKAELPAILSLDADGHESPVSYSRKGDYLVVDGMPARLVLRIGKGKATVTATQPNPSSYPDVGA